MRRIVSLVPSNWLQKGFVFLYVQVLDGADRRDGILMLILEQAS